MDVGSANPGGRGGIRIGDAERERAAQALGEHLRAGRIDVGEYDDRLTAAFGARTAGDLTPLFADLPGGSPVAPAVPEPQRRTAPSDRSWVERGGFRKLAQGTFSIPLRLALILVLIAGIIIFAVFVTVPPLFLIPLLWFGFGRRFGRRGRGFNGHGFNGHGFNGHGSDGDSYRGNGYAGHGPRRYHH